MLRCTCWLLSSREIVVCLTDALRNNWSSIVSMRRSEGVSSFSSDWGQGLTTSNETSRDLFGGSSSDRSVSVVETIGDCRWLSLSLEQIVSSWVSFGDHWFLNILNVLVINVESLSNLNTRLVGGGVDSSEGSLSF